MSVLRDEIGEVLRDERLTQGRTLRDVSARGRVSLTHLSEVERGRKEVSSETLGAICESLDLPLHELLRRTADRLELADTSVRVPPTPSMIPDTIPEWLLTPRR